MEGLARNADHFHLRPVSASRRSRRPRESPCRSGRRPDADFTWFPMQSAGLVSIPFGCLADWLGSCLNHRRRARRQPGEPAAVRGERVTSTRRSRMNRGAEADRASGVCAAASVRPSAPLARVPLLAAVCRRALADSADMTERGRHQAAATPVSGVRDTPRIPPRPGSGSAGAGVRGWATSCGGGPCGGRSAGGACSSTRGRATDGPASTDRGA